MAIERNRALDELAATICARQYNLASHEQLRAAGIPQAYLDNRLNRQQWARATDQVVTFPGASPSWRRDVMLGVLHFGPPTVVSGPSGCMLYNIPGFDRRPITLLSDLQGSHQLAGYDMSRTNRLEAGHMTVKDGIPILTPANLLFRLAGEVPLHKAAAATDHAIAMGLVTPARLHKDFDNMARRGRKGTRPMRVILAERPADYVPPASGAESRFLQVIHGLFPTPRRQVDVGDGEEWIGRVDFLFQRHGIIVEVQSVRHHTSVGDTLRDQRRHARLRAAGFTVVEVWADELFRTPEIVIDRLTDAFRTAAA